MHRSVTSGVNVPTVPEETAMLPATTAVDAEVDLEILKVVPKKFEVCDEKSANWLVRRIHNARQYSIHVKEFAQREQRRAEREEMTLFFLFGRQLERWARGEIEKLNGRRKSLCLPAGTVAFRTEAAKLVVDDEAVLMAWAKKCCPEAIQVSEKLIKTPINEHFKACGELPDGCHLEPENDTFRIV